MIELIVLLTVFTYGTNFVLYLILKNKKSMPCLLYTSDAADE